jgi:xylulokinase
VAADPAVRRDPVKALAFSASCDEVIAIDATGAPLGPCIMASDTRGGDEIDAVRAVLPEPESYRRTGLPVAAIHPLARIVWYRRHEPELAARAVRWLGWAEFLLMRLGLPVVADETTAGRWLAYDLTERRWWPEALASAGLDEGALPAVMPPSSVIGDLGSAARRLGLDPGAVVAAGAFDQICAAVGAGLVEPGDVLVGSGSWENCTVVLDHPLADAALDRGIAWGRYVADRYAGLIMNPAGGSALRWFLEQFGRDVDNDARRTGADPVGALLRSLPREPAHAMFLPHLQGSHAPWRDPRSQGAIVGLTLATTREELLRAVLEAITLELRLNLEALPGGPDLRTPIRNTGGGARSPEWVQMKADVLGRPIATVTAREPGCLGAAILAGVAAGAYSSVPTAQRRLCRLDRIVEPDPGAQAQYDARFALYRTFYPTVRDLAGAL